MFNPAFQSLARLRPFLATVCCLALLTALTGCVSQSPNGGNTATMPPGPGGAPAGPGVTNTFAPAEQAEIISAQDNHARKVQVTVTAPVKKMLREDTRGLPHERFLLQLANGSTVLVAHDTAMAPRVPLSTGDIVTLHGEYIWNEKGGVLHWTHHSDNGRHEGGYIDFQGQRYQ